MNFSKEFIIAIFLWISVLTYWIYRDINLLSGNYYSVSFFNVDTWDAILIKTPDNRKIVIDWWTGDQLLPNLSKKLWFFERTIDLVILSHSDLDHVWWLVELIWRYEIWEIWMGNVSHISSDFQQFLDIVKEKNIPYKFVNENSDIAFDEDLFIDILYPFQDFQIPEKILKNNNNNSIVLRMEIWEEKKSILFTWDNEKEVEEILVQRVSSLKSDIIKSPHHWSKTSSTTWFLLTVDPELVIFTAAKDNKFYHPHKVVVDRYKNLWIKTRQTWEENGIELQFN